MGTTFTGTVLTAEQLRMDLDDRRTIDKLMYGNHYDEDGPGPGRMIRVDLDKSYQHIHFLLTGKRWKPVPPLGLAIMGGRPVGPVEPFCYTRLLDADQVKTVVDALVTLDVQQLRESFDPEKFRQADLFPPSNWDEPYVFDTYLLPMVRYLTMFYASAATTGSAVLLRLC